MDVYNYDSTMQYIIMKIINCSLDHWIYKWKHNSKFQVIQLITNRKTPKISYNKLEYITDINKIGNYRVISFKNVLKLLFLR